MVDRIIEILKSPVRATQSEGDALLAKIEEGDSDLIFSTMANVSQTLGLDETMEALEKVCAINPELSLCLMIGLHGAASDQMAHEVCDAIELALAAAATPRIVAFSRRLGAIENEAVEGYFGTFLRSLTVARAE